MLKQIDMCCRFLRPSSEIWTTKQQLIKAHQERRRAEKNAESERLYGSRPGTHLYESESSDDEAVDEQPSNQDAPASTSTN
jgi:hypothetical protein